MAPKFQNFNYISKSFSGATKQTEISKCLFSVKMAPFFGVLIFGIISCLRLKIERKKEGKFFD
jgi:hypothetical protein